MTNGRSSQLRKGRFFQQGGVYHLRFSTKKRKPTFDFQNGRIVAKALVSQAARQQIELLAWVVMLDHVHLLVQLNGSIKVSEYIKQVKSTYTRNSGQPTVWQDGYFDRAIRAEDEIKTVARYIVANPIRAELVKKVADYSLWNALWI